ncbi:hypothetical protein V6N12_046113 [Hibiscus sabdariffa]|uniref:Transposase MuDR plant domain-containing protein n=1 Tax=Hibiscus sabdariffa TaxID=183260 RepID=A0ABR2G5U8_9ROSI
MMDSNTNLFVLKYFHGGKFVSSPRFDYVDYKTEKFQVDFDRLCYWDIVGNMKELGYDNDAWVYFRVLGVLFSTYALVFVADDDAIRQIVGFLNTRGIVELFVAVGNVRGIVAHDDESTIHDEGINEAVGKVVNDTNEYEHEAVNEVGEKETFQDSTGDEVPNIEDLSHNTTEVEQEECEKETSQDSAGDEVSDIEDLGHSTAEVELEAGEKETSQDSVDLLVNFEVAFDLDDEVEGIRVNVRADIHENSTYVSEGEENNDVECEGQPIVGNDLVEEDGDVTKIEGKLQDHERDYIEYDDPWEFEDHKQFKEAVRKYDIAKGVALRFKKSEPKRVKVCCKRMHVKRSWVNKGKTNIAPRAQQKLEKIWNFPLNVNWLGMVMEDLK